MVCAKSLLGKETTSYCRYFGNKGWQVSNLCHHSMLGCSSNVEELLRRRCIFVYRVDIDGLCYPDAKTPSMRYDNSYVDSNIVSRSLW